MNLGEQIGNLSDFIDANLKKIRRSKDKIVGKNILTNYSWLLFNRADALKNCYNP